MNCPCCSGKTYAQCCQPIINGERKAATPEQLMRSRYSAYTLANADYIYRTYASSTRAKQSIIDIKQWAQSVSFINLVIVNAPSISTDEESSFGQVEFIASYLEGTTKYQLHEISRFIIEKQQWLYLDGQIQPTESQSIGRNETCPCNSGKKFKRCHGAN